jgi:hypothetical protein
MASKTSGDRKVQALKEQGVLNPKPETVTDERFPGERVFRCARPGAGEVRDGAARERGRCGSDGSSGTLRSVAADVLWSAPGTGGGGARRTVAEAVGAEGAAQAHRRGDGGGGEATGQRSRSAQRDAGRLRGRAVWDAGAPAQHRASAGAPGKKTPAAALSRAARRWE